MLAKIQIIFEIIHNQAHFYTLLNKTGTNRSIYFVDVYSEIFIYSSIQLGQEGFEKWELDKVKVWGLGMGIGREVLNYILYLYIIYILYINIKISFQEIRKYSCPSWINEYLNTSGDNGAGTQQDTTACLVG